MDAPDLDANRSVWCDDLAPYAPAPPLRGPAVADLAIVGGGFTGVSTAWHIARRLPERRVVLLEARTLGNGASGRNGGQVLNWIREAGWGPHDTFSDDLDRLAYGCRTGTGRLVFGGGSNAAYAYLTLLAGLPALGYGNRYVHQEGRRNSHGRDDSRTGT